MEKKDVRVKDEELKEKERVKMLLV